MKHTTVLGPHGHGAHNMFNDKITLFGLIYPFVAGILVLLNSSTQFIYQLPHPALLGIALLCAGFGGILSYFYERRDNPRASWRLNFLFAEGAGLIIGLLFYYPIVERMETTSLWLGMIMLAGFANEVTLKKLRLAWSEKITTMWKTLGKDGDDTKETPDVRDEKNVG